MNALPADVDGFPAARSGQAIDRVGPEHSIRLNKCGDTNHRSVNTGNPQRDAVRPRTGRCDIEVARAGHDNLRGLAAAGVGVLVAVRGAGATARGRSLVANPWYELVRIAATGGDPDFLAEIRGVPWASDDHERT